MPPTSITISPKNCEYCRDPLDATSVINPVFSVETCNHQYAHIGCIAQYYLTSKEPLCALCHQRITNLPYEEFPPYSEDNNSTSFAIFGEYSQEGFSDDDISSICSEESEESFSLTKLEQDELLTLPANTPELHNSMSKGYSDSSTIIALIIITLPTFYFALQFFASLYFV